MRKCQIISYNQSKYKTESSNQFGLVEVLRRLQEFDKITHYLMFILQILAL